MAIAVEKDKGVRIEKKNALAVHKINERIPRNSRNKDSPCSEASPTQPRRFLAVGKNTEATSVGKPDECLAHLPF